MNTALPRSVALRVLLAGMASALLFGEPASAQEWKTKGKYAVKNMDPQYGPSDPLMYDGLQNIAWVKDPAERQNWKVEFRKSADGRTLLYRNGKPIDTRIRDKDGTTELRRAIFVMDAEGSFFMIMEEWVDWKAHGFEASSHPHFRHSTIPAGEPVAAAGLVEVVDGEIKYLSNESGHYLPENRHLVQAIKSLEEQGLSKSELDQKVDFRSPDHPGYAYLGLDPRGDAKVASGKMTRPSGPLADDPSKVRKLSVEDPNHKSAPGDNAGLLNPDEPTPVPELDVSRRARHQAPPPRTPEAAKPVDPPDPNVVERIRDRIAQTPVEQMDVKFVQEIYQLDPKAAKLVGQIMADPSLEGKNLRMGELRKTMDLQVWKDILKRNGIRVEITNQGKSNGVRSDLDYTLYYIAEEAGVSIKDLIEEHASTWQALHRLSPDRLEIKVMNGDEFYPDWRSEALSEAEHRAEVKRLLGDLRADPEKYSVPGANKQQVHNRALRDGWTEVLQYDPLLDKPEIPIERQVIRDQGLTREIALRYRGVHPQYNHMNALGNLIQNQGEFLHHAGDGAQDAIRRAKYFNRVINEGLGNLRFFANDYQKIFASDRPDRQALELEYLRKTLGLLKDDTGKPRLEDAQLRRFRDIIDISMQIELDKTGNKADYTQRRAEYFKDYHAAAESRIAEQTEGQDIAPEERAKLVLAEQERLFELDQKRVLAEAVLAGLRHTVARDLTPEGVLRNRVRFDPATQKFVINDPEGAKKVASERTTEVALFYELVNSLDDNDPAQKFMKRDMKKRALSTAPSLELAEFYGALDQVGKAEIDRFVAGDPESTVERKIDELLQKQQARALELLIERKQQAVDRAKAKGIAVDPNSVPVVQVRDHVVSTRLDRLNPYRRAQFGAAYQALGTRVAGEFKEAFYQNASGLMLGSSAVNLARAYQAGGIDALQSAVVSEAINYMPDQIQVPLLFLDIGGKLRRGDYASAAWQGSLWVALRNWPTLGNAMLAYNIATGVPDLVHTHFVTRIDVDLVEQALRSRPRDENGGPLRDGVRARPNRFPDAIKSVYKGSGPGFPLFYGHYRNQHAIAPIVIDAEKYSDGTVPHDNLSDEQLADSAGREFATQIAESLAAAGLEPGSSQWRKRAWDLSLKYGFDIPFYRRMAKVYQEKYKYITYYDNYPSPYNPEYLSECRLDVYDWYVRQPAGYKLELQGDASFWSGDQSDKMQELIARECAVVLGGMRKLAEQAGEAHQANLKALHAAMSRGFDAERALLAAKVAITRRIRTEEEKAAREQEQKALALAEKHQAYFAVSYPFTFASEELWPVLEFDMRMLPGQVKQPVEIEIDQVITGIKEGAPRGWKPGKQYQEKFQPDARGWVAFRPVTADVKFTAHLIDADKKPVAQSTLELPVVLYQPAFSGSIVVTVYGRTGTGDSTSYSGALVRLGSETGTSGDMGLVTFQRLKAGSHAVKVEPREGDQRHAPASGSAIISEPLVSKDAGSKADASVTVVLPYIPEPVVTADQRTAKPGEPKGERERDRDKKIKNRKDSTDRAEPSDTSTAAPPAAEDLVTVPDVAGNGASEAVGVLESAGLKADPAAAGDAPSKDLELTVTDQNPKSGSKVKRGSSVTVFVYQPFVEKVEKLVAVPDLSGLDSASAAAALQGAGLVAGFISPGLALGPNDRLIVAAQSEQPGKQLSAGSPVTIELAIVSEAPPQAYSDTTVTVPGDAQPADGGTVPDVVGLTLQEAIYRLAGANLTVTGVVAGAPPPTPDQALRIYRQMPPAGSPLPADMQATLTQYGSGEDVAAAPPPEPTPTTPAPPASGDGEFAGDFTGTMQRTNITFNGEPSSSPQAPYPDALKMRISQNQGSWLVAVEVTDRLIGTHGIGGPGGRCTVDGGVLRCEERDAQGCNFTLTIKVTGNELDGEHTGLCRDPRGVDVATRSVLKASRVH